MATITEIADRVRILLDRGEGLRTEAVVGIERRSLIKASTRRICVEGVSGEVMPFRGKKLLL